MSPSVFTLLLFALLSASVLYYILRPALRGSQRDRARREEQLERLEREKQALYQLLRELEFDYRTGKILDQDYRPSRAEVEGRAIAILRQLDELGRTGPWSDEALEAEIRRSRKRLQEEMAGPNQS